MDFRLFSDKELPSFVVKRTSHVQQLLDLHAAEIKAKPSKDVIMIKADFKLHFFEQMKNGTHFPEEIFEYTDIIGPFRLFTPPKKDTIIKFKKEKHIKITKDTRKILLESIGFSSLKEAKAELQQKAPEIYEYALNYYNVQVDEINKQNEFFAKASLNTYSIPEQIKDIIRLFEFADNYKELTIESFTVEKQNQLIKKKKVAKVNQLMKRDFVLKNGWLKYCCGISEYAYHNSDNQCVDYQLSIFLLDPPSGNATKYIGGLKVSQNTIFKFFQSFDSKITLDSGRSVAMVEALCNNIGRNMYCYDSDDKCFHSVLKFSSKNYCPIIFYKMHGHMYIISDKDCIRSVAEINKVSAKKIITATILDQKKDFAIKQNVYHCVDINIVSAKDLPAGIYIIQKSNLNEEVLKFISIHAEIPRTENRENVIIQFQFENNMSEKKNKQIVTIACDRNYKTGIAYSKIKHIADLNNIEYVNEGVGSVILKILDKKVERVSLSDVDRVALISSIGNKCQECELECENYEIDHIVPIASGGTNSADNLQVLCVNCHAIKTKEERERGEYKSTKNISSAFNSIATEKIFSTAHFKKWQFCEHVNPPKNILEDKTFTSYKIDMRKCRRNNTYYTKYEWPIYSVMDIAKPYILGDAITCGCYYVNTSNLFPFRGCGWYWQPEIEYGLLNELIKLEDIVFEFKPSKILPANYFQQNIDTLLDAFSCEPELQKLSVNAYIGLLGKTNRTASYSKFTQCEDEASEWWAESNGKYDVFIRQHTLENETILYEGIHNQQIITEKTNYCIYAMILGLEAIELHKLEQIVIREGGHVLERLTDCIHYQHNAGEITIFDEEGFWDEARKVVKYQSETPKGLACEKLPKMNRKHIEQSFDLEWTIKDEYEGTAKETARAIVECNCSMNIDGKAGTGKTYLVNEVIRELVAAEKKFLCLAPTNAAARLINGTTIDKLFNKFKNNKRKFIEQLDKLDFLIVDEISMVRETFFELFTMINKTFPKLKFIISGDFAQFQPVNDWWQGDYKSSPVMHTLCNGNRLQLSTCRRSNSELFNLYTNIDTIDTDEFPFIEPTYINLAYTHTTRKSVNNRCMDRYIKEFKSDKIVEFNADPKNDKTQNVKLAVGMPIICHTTHTNKKLNLELLNSQQFIIMDISEDSIIIKNENSIRTMTIKTDTFHKYFYIGFCITLHACQGKTFTERYTIYDWDFHRFDERAKYVGLSRGTNIKNIQIVANENKVKKIKEIQLYCKKSVYDKFLANEKLEEENMKLSDEIFKE